MPSPKLVATTPIISLKLWTEAYHWAASDARVRNQEVLVPAAAKAIPIGRKRKRGRPAKAKKALIM